MKIMLAMIKKDQIELNYENPNLQLELDDWINIDDEDGKQELLAQIRKELRIPPTHLLRESYRIYWDKDVLWIMPR